MSVEFLIDNHRVSFSASGPEADWIRTGGHEPWTGSVDGVEAGIIMHRPDEKAARAMVACSIEIELDLRTELEDFEF